VDALSYIVVKPRVLPETLPEMPAVESDESGLQPIREAWDEVFVQMRRAFGTQDYARAVDLGERFLQRHPTHAAALLFIQECRVLLEGRLARQLAPLDRVVVLRAPLATLTSSRIDPRTAFVLSQVDGFTTIEDLLDLAAVPRADALRILADALDGGLVAFE
jgi:hypothetical protein